MYIKYSFDIRHRQSVRVGKFHYNHDMILLVRISERHTRQRLDVTLLSRMREVNHPMTKDTL